LACRKIYNPQLLAGLVLLHWMALAS